MERVSRTRLSGGSVRAGASGSGHMPGSGGPAAPDRPDGSGSVPARRTLLRGGLALGAGAGVALADGLWGTARPAAAADTTGTTGTTDYAGAAWVPASRANYRAADRPASGPIDLVVIHVTQRTFADTVARFQDPSHRSAAHYVVRSADGAIDQCVRERDIARQTGDWRVDRRGVGIAHEGWVDEGAWFTTEMYHASAALTAAICERYGIPKDREHIIGASEVPGHRHHYPDPDPGPGPHWD